MDDDELNEELEEDTLHSDIDHEDAVLKTPPDSIKSKSPEPTNQSLDAINAKKVVLKRKLNIVVSPETPANEVSSTTSAEKTRKFTSITSPTSTDQTSSIPAAEKTDEDGTDKKVVKLSQLTAKERLELRAKKFGAPVSADSLKAARSERFGLTPVTTTSAAKTESNTDSSGKNGSVPSNVDLLKKRAERFGGSVSKEMSKIENLEKLQKRSERFGKSDENKATTKTATISSDEMAEKARMRLERFKTTV